jgi:hypothetical protein
MPQNRKYIITPCKPRNSVAKTFKNLCWEKIHICMLRSQILSLWVGGYSRLSHRVVVPVRPPMQPGDYITQSGTKNLATMVTTWDVTIKRSCKPVSSAPGGDFSNPPMVRKTKSWSMVIGGIHDLQWERRNWIHKLVPKNKRTGMTWKSTKQWCSNVHWRSWPVFWNRQQCP